MKFWLILFYCSTLAWSLDATVICAEARKMLKRKYVSFEMSSSVYMPGEVVNARIRLTNTDATPIVLPKLQKDDDYSFELMYQSSQYPGMWLTTGGRQIRNLADSEPGCFREVETLMPSESRVYATYDAATPYFAQNPSRWLAPAREGASKIQFEIFDLKLVGDYNVERLKSVAWMRVDDRRFALGEFGSATVLLVAEMKSQWILLASASRFTDRRIETLALNQSRPIDKAPWAGWDDASLVRIITSDQPIKLIPRLFEKKDVASLRSLEVEVEGKIHSFEAILDNAQKMKKRFYSDPNVPRLTLQLGDPD
jgi:hypothetical protein